MPFVTKPPKLTRRLVSALLIIHNHSRHVEYSCIMAVKYIRLYSRLVVRSSFLAKWLGERVRVSLVRSSVRSSILSLVRSSILSLVRSSILSLVRSSILSLVRSSILSSICSSIHSSVHSSIRSSVRSSIPRPIDSSVRR